MASKTKTTKSPASKKSSPAASDGLGRPGTVARFFRERILANPKASNESIVAAATKKFPKAGIASHWASWYRAEIVRNERASHKAAYGN